MDSIVSIMEQTSLVYDQYAYYGKRMPADHALQPMEAEKYHVKIWVFPLLLLAGTAARFVFGYSSKAWLAAPDQLAWGLGLDEMMQRGSLNYVELVHAPHEGGSLLISMVSLLFRPLTAIMPPLSWAALVIDTFSRAVQLMIAQKLFGNRTALLFGVWTVLSIPLLLPWGTVNYGLHALSSFIPFVFLYLAEKYRQSRHLPVICGIITGIAVSFSYDNIVLLAGSVCLLFSVSQTFTNGLKKLWVFAVFFGLAVMPHVILRICFDPATGSDVSEMIRDVSAGRLFSPWRVGNFFTVWFTSLPGALLLSSPGFLPAVLVCLLVCLFILAGTFWFVKNRKISKNSKLLSLSLVIVFITAYSLSPFYAKSFHETNYVYYRHWCYIIPLLVLIMIRGFISSKKWNRYITAAWLLVCGVASVAYMIASPKIAQPAYQAAGWILAKKYQGDPGKLFRIHKLVEQTYRNELLVGYGWGLSAGILYNKSDDIAVEKLVNLIRQSPAIYQPALVEGVYYSFKKGITPVLDSRLQFKLREAFSK